MIGGADKITSAWGHVYPGGYDLFVQIIARAVKQGFHVVLMQPNSPWPACTATDAAIKRGHYCVGCLENEPKGAQHHNGELDWDTLTPQENLSKVRPMVRTAVERAAERYGHPLNCAIDLHPSGLSRCYTREGPPSVLGPITAWLRADTLGEGGLQLVPPSVLGGEPVRVWSTVCHAADQSET